MGFFDKVTKAVGDVVDKGKREADQFMRIQKIKGEIGEIERKISGFTAEIAQVKADAGTKAIAMVRAGTLNAADLQPLADRVAGLEKQIEAEQAAVAVKRDDIEKIKAEDDEAVPVATTTAPPPPIPEAAPAVPADVPPPIPTDETK